jgi:hypothetical protein
MKIRRFREYSLLNEKISIVFMSDESKKHSLKKLKDILKAKSLKDLEDIDLAFDEVILPYGKKPESFILDDIKKKAEEYVETIPDGHRSLTPAEYQSKMKDYNLQNKYRDDNANKAYSDWD